MSSHTKQRSDLCDKKLKIYFIEWLSVLLRNILSVELRYPFMGLKGTLLWINTAENRNFLTVSNNSLQY